MSQSPTARRGSLRRAVTAEVRLRRTGKISYTVPAIDLSTSGCRVEFVERPLQDEIVWVKFDGLEPLEAIVRWTRDFTVGLEFRRSIDPRVLDLLLHRL